MQPEKEQSEYMKQEARRLFKAHKSIKDISRIEDKLVECEQRIELCLHYRNPSVFRAAVYDGAHGLTLLQWR